MTNKNKRSRTRSREIGPPPTASSTPNREGAPRRGILDSIFRPRSAGPTSMPRIGTSLGRGLAVVAGTPVIAIAASAIVAAEWLGALALGFRGPFAAFVVALAVPPVGTSFDAIMSTEIFGRQGGFFAIFGFVVLRAAVQAFLVATTVEVLRSIPFGRWTLIRVLRTLPVALAVSFASVGLLTLASVLGPVLPGFGLLVQMGTLVGGVYALGFAPVIAADEGRPLSDAMGRSVRGARMPGSGNLTLAAIYVAASITLLSFPGKPSSELGVNPTVAAWVLVLAANLLHVVMQAAIAFRYLSVADEVPEAAPRRRPPPRSRARR